MAKMIFKKFIEEYVEAHVGVGIDKVVRHKDGTYSFKHGFFYRLGMTSEKWAEKVSKGLEKAGVTFELVDSTEDWNAWPKDSWFVATFKIVNY